MLALFLNCRDKSSRFVPHDPVEFERRFAGLPRVQLGYRDRERRVKKESGTYRIAVFGDSMTEGVQVNLEQTYTYRVRLSRAGGLALVQVAVTTIRPF